MKARNLIPLAIGLASLSPASRATDSTTSQVTPSNPDKAILISLTPDILQEVAPELILNNPEAVGGAQLFYAQPISNSADQTGSTMPSDLYNAKLGIATPYEGVARVEYAGEANCYCWGSLDNMIGLTRDFWCRPSAAFYSISHPVESNGRVQLDFSNYYSQLRKTYSEESTFDTDYKQLLNAHAQNKINIVKTNGVLDKLEAEGKLLYDRHCSDETYGETLNILKDNQSTKNETERASSLIKDFRQCPYQEMLERSMECLNRSDEHAYASSLDKPVINKWVSSTKKKGNTSREKEWTDKLGKVWSHLWSLSFLPYEYRQADLGRTTKRADIRERRKDGSLFWRDERYKSVVLNASRGKRNYDGTLYLDTYEKGRLSKDYPKRGNNHGRYHFVPISAAVAKYSPTDNDTRNHCVNFEGSKWAEAAGVIACSNVQRSLPAPAYVLAILADHDRTEGSGFSGSDALTVTKNLRPGGGFDTNSAARVPEFSSVLLEPGNAGNAESAGTHYLHVEFPDNYSAASVSIRPFGGSNSGTTQTPSGSTPSNIRLSVDQRQESAPIACIADSQNVRFKAVLALPSMQSPTDHKTNQTDNRGWDVYIDPQRNMKNQGFLDNDVPPENIAQCSAANLSPELEEADSTCGEFILLGQGTIVEYRNTPYENTRYDFYLVTTPAFECEPLVAAGEIYLKWKFKYGNTWLAPVDTNLQKVYSVFDKTKLPNDGSVNLSRTADPSTLIHPWEDMLKTLGRLWLCDQNDTLTPYDNDRAWNKGIPWKRDANQARSDAAKAMTWGVKCSYAYPDSTEIMTDYILNRDNPFNLRADGIRTKQSYSGYTLQYCPNGAPYQMAFDASKLTKKYHIGNAEHKNLICADAMSSLFVLSRVAGFPGEWRCSGYTVKNGIGHAYLTLDGMVYDSTPFLQSDFWELDSQANEEYLGTQAASRPQNSQSINWNRVIVVDSWPNSQAER